MTYGFIYCFENRCLPGIYKIGKTDRSPTQRCWELSSSTSIPEPFDILFYVEVENALMVERQIHSAFDDVRVSHNREFFRVRPLDAYEWLRCNADIYTEYLDTYLKFELSKPALSVAEGGV